MLALLHFSEFEVTSFGWDKLVAANLPVIENTWNSNKLLHYSEKPNYLRTQLLQFFYKFQGIWFEDEGKIRNSSRCTFFDRGVGDIINGTWCLHVAIVRNTGTKFS